MAGAEWCSKLKFLIIDPHTGIRSHFRQIHNIASGLSLRGNEVVFLSCSGAMKNRCNVNEAFNRPMSFEVNRLDCSRCTLNLKNYSSLPDARGVKYISAKELLYDRSEILAKEANEIVAAVNRGIEFTSPSTGCHATKLALYETYLRFKLNSANLESPEQSSYQLGFALNANLMAHAAERLSKEFVPDAVIAYSPQYSAVGAAVGVFESQKIPCFFVEGSSALNERYSHIRIWNWAEFGLSNPRLQDFDAESYELVDADVESRISSHFRVIKNGTSFSVYSPTKADSTSPRFFFGIPKDAPIGLLSMSSSDEIKAAEVIGRFESDRTRPQVFESQIQWLEETIAWFRDRPDYYLVVRPHPRDFSTSREPVVAQHTQKILSALSGLPGNIVVDSPENPLPIWAYFKEIKALITGWSSTALESLFNGIPVVTYDSKITSFPSELSLSSTNKVSYFQNLESAMAGEVVVDERRKRLLTAWMHHNYFSHTLPLADRPFEKERVRSNFLEKVLNGIDYFTPRIYWLMEVLVLRSKASRMKVMQSSAKIETLI